MLVEVALLVMHMGPLALAASRMLLYYWAIKATTIMALHK
jgi:hypothetical protein